MLCKEKEEEEEGLDDCEEEGDEDLEGHTQSPCLCKEEDETEGGEPEEDAEEENEESEKEQVKDQEKSLKSTIIVTQYQWPLLSIMNDATQRMSTPHDLATPS